MRFNYPNDYYDKRHKYGQSEKEIVKNYLFILQQNLISRSDLSLIVGNE